MKIPLNISFPNWTNKTEKNSLGTDIHVLLNTIIDNEYQIEEGSRKEKGACCC